MISNDKLIRWRQVASRATPGVWTSIIKDDGSLLVNFGDQCNGFARDLYFGDLEDVDGEDIANSELIAESRAAIPELLDEVESLNATIEVLRRELHAFNESFVRYKQAHDEEIIRWATSYDHSVQFLQRLSLGYCERLEKTVAENEQLKSAVKDYITASTDEIVDDTDPYENDGLLYSKYVCRYCGEDDTYGHTDTCEWQKKLNQRTVAYDNLAKLIVDNVTGL
jgi:hypothetical protein